MALICAGKLRCAFDRRLALGMELSDALEAGSLSRVLGALEKGADPCFCIPANGRTVLAQACAKGMEEAAMALLEKGAGRSANKRDCYGDAALHSLAKGIPFEGSARLAQRLIEAGADAREPSATGNVVNGTALHYALRGGNLALAQFLLKSGADLESRDASGQTPLFCAAWRGDLQAFDWLLGQGADADAQDREGKGVLDYADREARDALAALAQKSGLEKALKSAGAGASRARPGL